ncbi:methylaspartate mutase [Streptomyces tauricus]|uniref:cobalamin-dependent protein n=1 Tax=Streptomyces tauricus TaxID=68274 RepID=UPI00167B5144|nr:cobalamin-dependent protein [Streptomyces tauricus]GHA26861.1 methylaspartate mutase [Streptomyces tauricus]
MPWTTPPPRRLVILGVAASDCHVVANQLIARFLRDEGFEVENLGACTPVEEFARACVRRPEAEAVLVGSLNGHIHEDLRGLREAKRAGRVHCPVVVGGNLSVGCGRSLASDRRLYALGVDRIVHDPATLPTVLAELRTAESQFADGRFTEDGTAVGAGAAWSGPARVS